MGIYCRYGNLLESEYQTLGVTVNTVGAMGAGIAKAFAKQWPDLEVAYKDACRAKYFRRHPVFSYPVNDTQQALCIVTKHDWRNPSQLEWIEQALTAIRYGYLGLKIESLALPKLGCGKGGLDWAKVRPLIIDYLEDLPFNTYLYE